MEGTAGSFKCPSNCDRERERQRGTPDDAGPTAMRTHARRPPHTHTLASNVGGRTHALFVGIFGRASFSAASFFSASAAARDAAAAAAAAACCAPAGFSLEAAPGGAAAEPAGAAAAEPAGAAAGAATAGRGTFCHCLSALEARMAAALRNQPLAACCGTPAAAPSAAGALIVRGRSHSSARATRRVRDAALTTARMYVRAACQPPAGGRRRVQLPSTAAAGRACVCAPHSALLQLHHAASARAVIAMFTNECNL